jgi:hypothetical protein
LVAPSVSFEGIEQRLEDILAPLWTRPVKAGENDLGPLAQLAS